MASPAVVPDFRQVALSEEDGWVLYQLAYFPGAPDDMRRALLAQDGLTDAGRRIGRFLLDGRENGLSAAELFIGRRYLDAAAADKAPAR